MMKKLLYLFVATLMLTSCTKNLEPWEKDPLSLEVSFVIETPRQQNSIITTKIDDGTIGEVSFFVKEEGAIKLPYNKTYFNQKITYSTFSELVYRDRTVFKSIADFNAFVPYNVTLKMYVDGVLKAEAVKEIAKPDNTVSISFDFKEYFE